MGEYARSNTAIVNSFLWNTIDRYVSGPEQAAEVVGLRDDIMVMQANGGIVRPAADDRRRHAAVRARRRHDRHRLRRQDARPSQRHHRRHGRHELRRRPADRLPVLACARADRGALPPAAADDRRGIDRRRRRHHRARRSGDRTAAGRARQRRRRSRADLLRHGRHAGHRHRRQRGAGLYRSGLFPRRPAQARQEGCRGARSSA